MTNAVSTRLSFFGLTLLVSYLFLPQKSHAEQEVDLLDISLQDLMNVKVKTATKSTQEATKTPAIVSVITSDDILNWGYQSVAEALQQVPGLYGINDFVNYNYGVRGINGGQRAYSRILKVMINDVAVPFRSDSTNFLGPELIPVEVIQRIEVVRGPGSALYGENAFMGIINIITKERVDEQIYRLRFGDNEHLSAAFSVNQYAENWSLTFSSGVETNNYDGLSLPEVSPRTNSFTGLTSENSDSRPQSLFAQWKYKKQSFVHDIMFSYSHLDVIAEFLDFGTLSHENRISLDKSHLSYKMTWNYAENLDWNLSLSTSQGKPSNKERLSLNSSTSYPVREFDFNVLDFSSEILYQTNNESSYIFGLDHTYDQESLIQVSNFDIGTGDITLLSPPSNDVTLKNLGLYVQYLKNLTDDTLLTLNLRQDDHNIYGTNTNYRVGIVNQYSKQVSFKFLLGSSYKAPAAMQLFAQPLYPGEVIGNSELLAEEADTIETEISWFYSKEIALSLNLWFNQIDNKVELLPVGPNVQPLNSGKQKGAGLETELKWIGNKFRLIANLAFQDTDNQTETLFQGTLTSPTAAYPELTGYLRYQFDISAKERIGFALKYASERRANNSNIRENLLQPYQLDDYVTLKASYLKFWGNWTLQINADNLLDEEYEEPGFFGIDIPGNQRSVYLNLRYAF